MTTPAIVDTHTWTAIAGSTSIAIDLSLLSVPSHRSKIAVYVAINTTSNIFSTTTTNITNLQSLVAFGPGFTQLFNFDYYGDPTQAGSGTISWTGATGTNAGAAIAMAVVVDAGAQAVYRGGTNNGSGTTTTFDCNNLDLPGTDTHDALYLLLASLSGTSTSSTVTAPTGWPDTTFGPFNNGSLITLLMIDHSVPASTGNNPNTWTIVNAGTGLNPGGYSFFTAGASPPVNDLITNAIELTDCSGTLTGTTVGATVDHYEALNADYDAGMTVWYTFTGKSGEFVFEAFEHTGSTSNPDIALFEADVGETNEQTIMNGFVTPNISNSPDSGGHIRTYSSLDPTKQYWLQVDELQAWVGGPGRFDLTWYATTGFCGENTLCTIADVYYKSSAITFLTSYPGSVTLPSTYSSGDLLLIFAGASWQNGVTTAPTGWTLLAADSTFQAIYGRIADGTEGASVTWQSGAPFITPNYNSFVAAAYSGPGVAEIVFGFSSGFPDGTASEGYFAFTFGDAFVGETTPFTVGGSATTGQRGSWIVAYRLKGANLSSASFPWATWSWASTHIDANFSKSGDEFIVLSQKLGAQPYNLDLTWDTPAGSFLWGGSQFALSCVPTSTTDVLSTVATIDHDLLIGMEEDQHHAKLHDLAGQDHSGGFFVKTGAYAQITDADFTVAPVNGQVAMTYDTQSGQSLWWVRAGGTWDPVEVTS